MKQYEGKTVLYSVAVAEMDGMVSEATVDTFSPSGKFVYLGHRWWGVDKVSVLEVMPEEAQTSYQQQIRAVPLAGMLAPDNGTDGAGRTNGPTAEQQQQQQQQQPQSPTTKATPAAPATDTK